MLILGWLGGIDLINVIKPDILDHKHLCKFLLLNSYVDAEATDIEMTFKIRWTVPLDKSTGEIVYCSCVVYKSLCDSACPWM